MTFTHIIYTINVYVTPHSYRYRTLGVQCPKGRFPELHPRVLARRAQFTSVRRICRLAIAKECLRPSACGSPEPGDCQDRPRGF